MATIPDQQLLKDFAEQGSEEAFSELVRRHVRLVYGSALRQLGDEGLAQDVTQAVFLILSQRAAGLGPRVVLAGWLYQTTRFAVSNARRGESRRRRMEERMAKLEDMQGEPLGSAETWRSQVEPLVDEALSKLGESDRTALVLHYLEDKSLREVGQALGSSEDAAQKRVSRALDRLKGLLKRKGVAVSVAGLAGVLQGCSAQSVPASLVGSVALASSAATTSAPLLSFTQQTLTLMAWTKTKSVMIAAAAVVAFLGGVTTSYWWAQKHSTIPAGALAGAWEGTLKIKDQVELRLVTHLQAQPDGTYKASLDSVDQGVANIPIPVVELQGRTLKLALPALNARYEAQVGQGETAWDGTWSQLGLQNPMRFVKTDQPTSIRTFSANAALERRRDFDVQGRWEGTLRVPGAALRLLFKIQESAPERFVGALDSIDQGVRDVPISGVKASGSNVVFEVASIGGRFEGAIDAASTEIEGDWSQGGKTFSLDLKRVKAVTTNNAVAKSAAEAKIPQKIAGSWRGTLQVNGVKLRLRMEFAPSDSGESRWVAKLDSIDQGARGIPSTMASFEEDELRAEWKGIGAVYTAQLDGEDLIGQWKQGAATFSLTMQREEAK